MLFSVSLGASVLFKWRGRSCLDSGERSCWLGHGDILVMDGQCQDEFLHCTSPGLEHERINVTYRWIRQHTHFCPLFKAGMVCCLPTCAKGSSVQVTVNLGYSCFWAFWFLLCVLCMLDNNNNTTTTQQHNNNTTTTTHTHTQHTHNTHTTPHHIRRFLLGSAWIASVTLS